ncbi:hypothetical protein HNR62_002253 [Oceanisphaera litoralis]|uniref:recombination directionality factor n=1 Tax=Oceanisphaera litoralis TaxID=225144 RepID=UPI00195EFB36|nr:hypothetical protein [Oceanisphaera litoralis]MBM7456367.1 hypothetical protein [Oceanisphaera litoralis]
MIKGLAITPPIIGRISIGKLVNKNDKWLPEKDDSFTLTTQIQNRSGWMLHPLHQRYSEGAANGKIRSIPVKVLFNDSDLNLRAEYSAFDRSTGRPICVGNGEVAKRVGEGGIEEVPCPSPERCRFAYEQGCKLYGRLNVQVDGQNDELGSFIFRTTGYNSVRTLAARLRYFEAITGGNTRHLLLQLKLRAKSTTQSYRTPVFYVDLTLRDEDTLAEAVSTAQQEAEHYRQSGVDIASLENTAKQLLHNGQFEDGEEENSLLLDEFYPEQNSQPETTQDAKPTNLVKATRLTNKLGTAE